MKSPDNPGTLSLNARSVCFGVDPYTHHYTVPLKKPFGYQKYR
ncbi:hypothetical protein ASZ90_009529 [hydrocarbon metagenome]|uniref:Uncharacterized protein n=1 Tax=hydrocarbon metagenome TaxID=938273 RepID=A0A0W8FIQ9_9ZZZZ